MMTNFQAQLVYAGFQPSAEPSYFFNRKNTWTFLIDLQGNFRNYSTSSRWWFQIFFIFNLTWEMIHFDDHICQMGWNHQQKPPAFLLRKALWCLRVTQNLPHAWMWKSDIFLGRDLSNWIWDDDWPNLIQFRDIWYILLGCNKQVFDIQCFLPTKSEAKKNT